MGLEPILIQKESLLIPLITLNPIVRPILCIALKYRDNNPLSKITTKSRTSLRIYDAPKALNDSDGKEPVSPEITPTGLEMIDEKQLFRRELHTLHRKLQEFDLGGVHRLVFIEQNTGV